MVQRFSSVSPCELRDMTSIRPQRLLYQSLPSHYYVPNFLVLDAIYSYIFYIYIAKTFSFVEAMDTKLGRVSALACRECGKPRKATVRTAEL
jgi:hypothetical protein